eukprot:Skav217447  [mRNA]  locus=scaffold518:80717:95352:+ [translate_table: standard]
MVRLAKSSETNKDRIREPQALPSLWDQCFLADFSACRKLLQITAAALLRMSCSRRRKEVRSSSSRRTCSLTSSASSSFSSSSFGTLSEPKELLEGCRSRMLESLEVAPGEGGDFSSGVMGCSEPQLLPTVLVRPNF